DDRVDLFLQTEKNLFEKVIQALGKDDLLSVLKADYSFKNFPAKKKDSAELQTRDYIKDTRLKLKNKCFGKNGVITNAADLIEYAHEDMQLHREIVTAAFNLYRITDEKVHQAKISRDVCGYGDAERLVLKLLAKEDKNGNITATPLAKKLSGYYKVIMIDEFQDSNDIQDLIFKLISDGGTSMQYGKNVFIVGDVKQAIYRFRGANPSLFLQLTSDGQNEHKADCKKPCKSEFPVRTSLPGVCRRSNVRYRLIRINKKTLGKNKPRSLKIMLNENFRSSKGVVDFVNGIFRQVMTKECGGVDYTGGEELVQCAVFPDTLNSKTLITVIGEEYCNDENTNHEALCAAEQIRQMLNQSVPVNAKGGIRPCQPKDFCILTRKNINRKPYLDALDALNIPVDMEEETGYLKSREVSVLINLLKVIDNPLLDIALVSVMMSPMFAFTLDEIVQIRLADRNISMYQALEQLMTQSEYMTDSLLRTKLRNFYTTLTELRQCSIQSEPQELIRKIYDGTDYLSVVQIQKDSEKRKANLRMLTEYASAFGNGHDTGLSGFLRHIDNLLRLGKDFGEAAAFSGSENAVSIKSIHKSKGLEYPFVFLVNTDCKFSRQDKKSAIQYAREYGFGFKLQDRERLLKYSTLPYENIVSLNHRELVSEEMRLMYVALTRAKDRLFITLKPRKNAVPAESADCMGDWISASLDTGLSAETEHCVYVPKTSEPFRQEDFDEAEPDGLLTEILRKGIDFEYKWKDDTRLPAKLVVTGFEKMKEDFYKEDFYKDGLPEMFCGEPKLAGINRALKAENQQVPANSDNSDPECARINRTLKIPQFMEDGFVLEKKETGTALHILLQHTDFNLLAENPERETERLVQRGFLTQKQAQSINRTTLKNFIQSSFFQRILKAERIKREMDFLVAVDDLNVDPLDPDYMFLMKYKQTDGFLAGTVDIVIEEEDGLLIADYKLGASVLTDSYARQLRLYKMALSILTGNENINTCVFSFKLNRMLMPHVINNC
ncbi:MAG: UvrD-helicase domain-containing protein, partial [Oscillospiraceae bacterium]|nr:UvrD-helicase domain-containing protein [Oscillospiraceae bacterium]